MNDIEKQVAIRNLQKEIDKRCSFFRIITDMGAAGPKEKPKVKKQLNPS